MPTIPNYEWKPIAETIKAVGIAVVVFVALSATRLGDVKDWSTYLTTFIPALASVIGTAVLGVLTKPQ